MDKIKEFETEIGYIKEDRIKKRCLLFNRKITRIFF